MRFGYNGAIRKRKGGIKMARPKGSGANPELKEGTVYKSQKEANKNYKKTVDQIVLRVPKGSRDLINQWVAEKADNGDVRCIDGRLGKPSVNTFVMHLLAEEMKKDGKTGIDLGIEK